MALDRSDPFPNLRRPSLFGPAKRVTKSVTKIPSVTELRQTVTEMVAAPKRGRQPRGDHPLTAAEKQRRYRERKRATKEHQS